MQQFGPATQSSSHGRLTRAVRATLAVLVLAVLQPLPLAAQEEEATGVDLSLAGMPVWHGPGDSLDMRLRISNGSDEVLRGLRVRVGVRDRVLSRSALEESYAAAAGFESSVAPINVRTTVDPGTTAIVRVDPAVSAFPTLVGATDGGVFPATLTLQNEVGDRTFASITVPLVYHPERPEVPLSAQVVLPMNDGPSRAPDGTFPATEEGERSALEVALEAEAGWLAGYMDALEEVTVAGPRRRPQEGRVRGNTGPLRVALAPAPRLLEEVTDLAAGATRELQGSGGGEEDEGPAREPAQRFLARLRALFEREEVEPALVPYAFPDLPDTVASLPLRQTVEQFSTTNEVWLQALGRDNPTTWLFPPGGRLDLPSMEQIQLLGHASRVVVGESSLESLPATAAGCPETFLSFTCAIRLETGAGTSEGLVIDERLERTLGRLGADPTEDRYAMQRFFAELAMVHAELPGTPGRIIQITLPAGWEPGPRQATFFLRGLARAPWLRTVALDRAVELSSRNVERTLRASLPSDSEALEQGVFDQIERARGTLDSYATALPPGNQRLRRLRRNLLVAAGRSWLHDPDEARRYVAGTVAEVEGEIDKITLTGARDVTLTSQRGQVQVVLTNEATQPIRLALRLISPNLRFDRNRIVDTYPPGSHALTLDMETTGSGIFQLDLRLETTDGTLLVEQRRVVVRSTSFNQVALGVTVGALFFLIAFYIYRIVRRGKREEEPNEQPA